MHNKNEREANAKKKFLIALLAFVLVFSFVGCTSNNTDNNKNNKPITKTSFGRNETATTKNLKVTATKVQKSIADIVFTPEEGNAHVGICFTIEIAFQEDLFFSAAVSFEVARQLVTQVILMTMSAAF